MWRCRTPITSVPSNWKTLTSVMFRSTSCRRSSFPSMPCTWALWATGLTCSEALPMSAGIMEVSIQRMRFHRNNCGLHWSFGRLGAEGLRQICAYVSPANAKPGDLIFFQGTCDTTGASHVGIYVGNNTMLHCGDPIQYSDITSSYWQQHFYQFGRLPSP